jgi:thiosulfate/3-mercaptopyruvate sulfurtransferase
MIPFSPRHAGRVIHAALLLAAIAIGPAHARSQPTGAPLTVSTTWLAEHLKDPNVVLLHVGERAEYDAGHIPGARHVKLDDVAASSHDHERGLMLEMPDADALRTRLESLGVSNGSRVVVYYGSDWVSPATRVLFTLDYAGLGASSVLLDGGMAAWRRDGRTLSRELPDSAKGRLAALRIKPIVVDAAWVKARLGTPGFRLVDGRASVFYDGLSSSGQRKGHVPGAKSIPYTEIADDRLFLRSPSELRSLFAKAGIAPGDTVVAYCHIGQQATAVLFAARTLGHPVLLYDGSFQDWSRRTELPVLDPRANKSIAQ